jgi:hypothetical protein
LLGHNEMAELMNRDQQGQGKNSIQDLNNHDRLTSLILCTI